MQDNGPWIALFGIEMRCRASRLNWDWDSHTLSGIEMRWRLWAVKRWCMISGIEWELDAVWEIFWQHSGGKWVKTILCSETPPYGGWVQVEMRCGVGYWVGMWRWWWAMNWWLRGGIWVENSGIELLMGWVLRAVLEKWMLSLNCQEVVEHINIKWIGFAQELSAYEL